MPNYRSHLDSPSKQALQMYLDDLTLPNEVKSLDEKSFRPKGKELTASAIEDNKLSAAKNLVEKANALSTLMLSEPNVATPAVALDMASKLLQESNLLEPENNDETTIQDKELSTEADNHTKSGLRIDGLTLADSLTERFQVLLCQIGGVTVAIPLVELGSIMQINKFTNQAKKQSWFKGLFIKGDQTYTCIDMAAQIAPNNHLKCDDNGEYKYLVQLGKSEYALCCNNVDTTLEIEKPDVKWRSDISKQPWLAGILKDKMCALIDGAEMVRDVLKQD